MSCFFSFNLPLFVHEKNRIPCRAYVLSRRSISYANRYLFELISKPCRSPLRVMEVRHLQPAQPLHCRSGGSKTGSTTSKACLLAQDAVCVFQDSARLFNKRCSFDPSHSQVFHRPRRQYRIDLLNSQKYVCLPKIVQLDCCHRPIHQEFGRRRRSNDGSHRPLR